MSFTFIQRLFSKISWFFTTCLTHPLNTQRTMKWGEWFICILKRKAPQVIETFTHTHKHTHMCTHTHTHTERALVKANGSTFLYVWILPSQDTILLQNILWMWRIITRELHSVFSRAAVWILIIFSFSLWCWKQLLSIHSRQDTDTCCEV